MKTQQTQVAQWMIKFGQNVRNTPTIPPLEERKLRAKLILEEALETIAGLGIKPIAKSYDETMANLSHESIYFIFVEHELTQPSLIAIADGIADSLVVQLGTAVACGIDIMPVFDEVMRSNDSKLWTIKDLEILQRIAAEKGEHKVTGEVYSVVCKDITTLRYLVKDKDGKVIKSPSYSPANVEAVLKAQTNLLKESAT